MPDQGLAFAARNAPLFPAPFNDKQRAEVGFLAEAEVCQERLGLGEGGRSLQVVAEAIALGAPGCGGEVAADLEQRSAQFGFFDFGILVSHDKTVLESGVLATIESTLQKDYFKKG